MMVYLASSIRPRVNNVNSAVVEVFDISSREFSRPFLGNSGNLTIRLAERPAECATMSGDLRKDPGGAALKSKNAALEVFCKNSFGRCQQPVAALPPTEKFNPIEDFCFGN